MIHLIIYKSSKSKLSLQMLRNEPLKGLISKCSPYVVICCLMKCCLFSYLYKLYNLPMNLEAWPGVLQCQVTTECATWGGASKQGFSIHRGRLKLKDVQVNSSWRFGRNKGWIYLYDIINTQMSKKAHVGENNDFFVGRLYKKLSTNSCQQKTMSLN